MNDAIICADCGELTDALAVFPGGTCLGCYKKTPAAYAPFTAEEIARMWGGGR